MSRVLRVMLGAAASGGDGEKKALCEKVEVYIPFEIHRRAEVN